MTITGIFSDYSLSQYAEPETFASVEAALDALEAIGRQIGLGEYASFVECDETGVYAEYPLRWDETTHQGIINAMAAEAVACLANAIDEVLADRPHPSATKRLAAEAGELLQRMDNETARLMAELGPEKWKDCGAAWAHNFQGNEDEDETVRRLTDAGIPSAIVETIAWNWTLRVEVTVCPDCGTLQLESA